MLWVQSTKIKSQPMSNFLKFLRQSKYYKHWIRLRQQYEDRKQNRDLIGEDRFGNKYYQYYSFFGLPTRREVRFKNDIDFALRDLVYYQWLHHQVYDPPSEEQKQRYYLEQKVRYEKALQWDRKQEMQMLEFKRQREELLLRNQALKQIQQQMKANQKLIDIKTKRQEQNAKIEQKK